MIVGCGGCLPGPICEGHRTTLWGQSLLQLYLEWWFVWLPTWCNLKSPEKRVSVPGMSAGGYLDCLSWCGKIQPESGRHHSSIDLGTWAKWRRSAEHRHARSISLWSWPWHDELFQVPDALASPKEGTIAWKERESKRLLLQATFCQGVSSQRQKTDKNTWVLRINSNPGHQIHAASTFYLLSRFAAPLYQSFWFIVPWTSKYRTSDVEGWAY